MAVLCYLAAIWGLVIWHLGAEWSINTQYRYGWFVPALVLYLIGLRMGDRPKAGPPFSRVAVISAVVVAACLEAIAFLFHEANPEWRLLGWIFAGTAIGVTLTLLGGAGGWPWVRHFAFPICFFLTALPWPRPQEASLTMAFAQHNAAIVSEALHWLGYDAVASGNLVKTTAGVIGVDEACSGIRSLQGTLMVTLFLGELFRFVRVVRVFLLVLGVSLALLANIVRTMLLGVLTATSGVAGMERWHDTIGYATLAVGFGLVLAAASAAKRYWPGAITKKSASIAGMPNWRETFAGVHVVQIASWVAIAILGLSIVGTQAWFRWNERGVVPAAAWKMVMPRENPTFQSVDISSRVRGELRFDFGESGRWTDDHGWRWQASYFEWKPGWNGEQAVLVHDPRVCMQAVGMQVAETLPDFQCRGPGLPMDFECYRFRDGETDVFVFNCVTDDVIRTGVSAQDERSLTRGSRWQAVAHGIRHLGQRRLEIGVWGTPLPEQARAALTEFLQRHLQVSRGNAG